MKKYKIFNILWVTFFAILGLAHITLGYFSPKYSDAVKAVRNKMVYSIKVDFGDEIPLKLEEAINETSQLTGLSKEELLTASDTQISKAVIGKAWPAPLVGANMRFIIFFAAYIACIPLFIFLLDKFSKKIDERTLAKQARKRAG